MNRSPTKYLPVFPKKPVRSWSHTSWVANGEILLKKTLASPFLNHYRREEVKKV